ncbi:MAG: hypothetical protein NVS4B2_27100 [Chloroflexota bacterium]
MRSGLIGVEKRVLVLCPAVPARAVQEPAAIGEWAVFTLPLLDMGDLEKEVRIVAAFSALVYDHGGSQKVFRRNLGNVDAVSPGDPVDGRIEVRAYMLPH